MRSKTRKQSLSRAHKDNANEHKEGRTTPDEASRQSSGETRSISPDATNERRSARASSRRHPSGDSEFELPI